MAPPYPVFTLLSEAIQRARDMVKGEFCMKAEVEGEVSEVEWTCVQVHNTQWAIKANPLSTQIQYLLIGLDKATRYTPEELSFEPGLTLCGLIMDLKQKIDCIASLWRG